MSAFILKIIAIITMSIDHIGYVIHDGHFSNFNYIGRIAFPIFAFQISEGYIHTKNLKKYFLKLFIFAIFSQVPYMLFNSKLTDQISLNVMFTLLLGLFAIFVYDKCKYKIIAIFAALLIGLLAQISHCDYGFYGIAIIFIFYILKNNFMAATSFFVIATFCRYSLLLLKYGFHPVVVCSLLFTCLPILFIALYNGKKGKDTKYLLYWFYPIHLLVIYGINWFLN